MSDEDVTLSPAHGDEAMEVAEGAPGGEERREEAEEGGRGKKDERKKAARGKRMTPSQRMLQFPGEFFIQGTEMWCISCQATVDHREKATPKRHLEGAKHMANKKKRLQAVMTPAQ